MNRGLGISDGLERENGGKLRKSPLNNNKTVGCEMTEKIKIRRCYWCGRFIGNKGHTTVKEPDIFYCSDCYEKGIEIEEEAMYGTNHREY